MRRGCNKNMPAKRIYIKIGQHVEVCNSRVFFEDLGKVYSTDPNISHAVNKLEVLQIKSKENVKYMVSILKLIELIQKKYPDAEIINVGEKDFIISYIAPGKKRPMWEYVKAALICVIIGVGAAFSIMTFNTDVSVGDVFDKSYEILNGEGAKSNGIVELSYSIGLPLGMCVFFNHFSRKATKNDPTPLQVEMRTYEEDVNKALIQNAAREGKTIDAN